MNKKILGAIVVILLLVLGVGGYYFYQKQLNQKVSPSDTPSPSNQVIVGGDKDEHGCIGSAGYSWCEPKNKCLRIWEEACYANAQQEIQYLLAQKYSKPVTDVTLRVNKETSDYMAGSVSFAAQGLPSPGEDGMFLAAKEGHIWTLVYDGNGSIDCVAIKQNYNFPSDMLTGFCD